jgi:hypothetical protein
MASEPQDWTVPAPLRALLWWPPLAFLLVLLEPTAAALTIAATGAALAVLGAVGTTVGRLIAHRRTGPDRPATPAVPIADRAVPIAVEQRAA